MERHEVDGNLANESPAAHEDWSWARIMQAVSSFCMSPFWALVQRDLMTVAHSWVARGFLGVTAIAGLVTVMSRAQMPGASAADVAANWQITYLIIWNIFVIVLTAGAVSSEAGVMADAILSRPVKRYHYILAKLTARSIAVLIIFLAVAGPVTYAAWRYAGVCDIESFWDVVVGTMFVALALLMLTALGVFLSSVMRSSLLAILSLALLWYAAGAIFQFLSVSYLSPFGLAANLPAMFRGELDSDLLWKTPLGFFLPTVIVWLGATAHFNCKDV